MLRTIWQAAKSNLRGLLLTSLTRFASKTRTAITVSSSGMAELHRLLLTVSGADGRNRLDPEALAGVDQAVLNSGQPELIFLYRSLLADDDIEADTANRSLSILRSASLSRVGERALALVANCGIFSH